MKQTIYEDYKYCMQDVSSLYVGAKYTLGEIVEAEDILFKFRALVERYILPDSHPQDTLESQLYYLQPQSFAAKMYGQLKARVKINIIEEKKTLLGSPRRQFTTRVIGVEELAKMSPEEKKEKGVVVQELIVSKLAIAAF